MCDCILTPDERERKAISLKIDKMIAKEKKNLEKEFKLLLLGTGEAGKSTFIKQMKIISGIGFDDKEQKKYKVQIYDNIFEILKTITKAMGNLKIEYELEENYLRITEILKTDGSNNMLLTPSNVQSIKNFWKDSGVQKCYNRRNEYQLIDPTEYLMNAIDRISEPNYIPTEQDMLQARHRTTDIVENKITIKNKIFKIIDVGGQRSERRKWLDLFYDVTSVIYLVALSEYDQTLLEANEMNRMKESIALFNKIFNHDAFRDSLFILFLNKVDLFETKIKKSKISKYFPEYKGTDGDLDESKKFILELFSKQKDDENKPMYHHYTCATDTNNIKIIFDAVRMSIINSVFTNYVPT